MKFEEICSVLERLEQDNDVNALQIQGIALWPLIRQCIWAELLKPESKSAQFVSFSRRILRKLRNTLHISGRFSIQIPPGISTIFISQPENLQELPSSGQWFDRIIDPLLFLESHQTHSRKYYLGNLSRINGLFFPGSQLLPGITRPISEIKSVSTQVIDLFIQAGLPKERALPLFKQAYRRFYKFYRTGLRIFKNRPNLQRMYISSWYTPENMGLIAAARELGINTIDVQHGKQGRYQAMYSWWTSIPDQGYQMLPEWFWCWGNPSVRHILAHSSKRPIHKPFVGGFPWPDYFRRYIFTHKQTSANTNQRKVLFTLQPPLDSSFEPIPDFVLNYLKSDLSANDLFIFRGHPNYPDSIRYCKERLREVSEKCYDISDGRENLYNELLESTHHITAFSSCCYEAEMCGIPTLLFGTDAQSIYSDEIEFARFSWTEGHLDDLCQWLDDTPKVMTAHNSQYIEASLSLASNQLQALRHSPFPAPYSSSDK